MGTLVLDWLRSSGVGGARPNSGLTRYDAPALKNSELQRSHSDGQPGRVEPAALIYIPVTRMKPASLFIQKGISNLARCTCAEYTMEQT